MAAYTQKDIDDLIACLKKVSVAPKREMKLVGAHWRNDMTLVASNPIEGEFHVFMRRSEDFQEDFSIGVRFHPKDERGEITLLRCNGQHGVCNGSFDPEHPHWAYHLHKADEQLIDTGLRAEKSAQKTGEYASFEEALEYFVKIINLDPADVAKYFPKKSLLLF